MRYCCYGTKDCFFVEICLRQKKEKEMGAIIDCKRSPALPANKTSWLECIFLLILWVTAMVGLAKIAVWALDRPVAYVTQDGECVDVRSPSGTLTCQDYYKDTRRFERLPAASVRDVTQK